MGPVLQALLHLQTIEQQRMDVRRRLRTRRMAVMTQQKRIDDVRAEHQALMERSRDRRKEADGIELELRTHAQEVEKLRAALNQAKTNKEYAALLTQINSLKADDAKLEEDGLKIIQEADTIRAEAEQVSEKVAAEEARLADIEKSNAEQIRKLEAMMDELDSRRAEAVKEVPAEALAVFERIAENYDGEAMAAIEIHGKKPPHDYVCGGCFMTLTAEHANALRTRDQVRTCDNCGRILYIQAETASRA